ncbi:MAG: Hsp20/alpha crystallin family protein [Chloroflexi bacterium]|nr:Hsp20/alpha crystallin family protein [Chloroflexota bacterium]
MTFYIQPYPYRRMSRRMAAMNGGSSREHFLNVNVRDEEDTFVLSALVPGLKADDLNIQVLEDVVRIEGEFQANEEDYLLQELPSGSFHRALRMPSEIDANKVEAKITDGVLTLRLPKAESARPKKIKIAVK